MYDKKLEKTGFQILKPKDRIDLYNNTLGISNNLLDDASERLTKKQISGICRDVFDEILDERIERTNNPKYRTGGVLEEYKLVEHYMRTIINPLGLNVRMYIKMMQKEEQEALSFIVYDKIAMKNIDAWKNDWEENQPEVVPPDVRLRRTVISIRDILSSIRDDKYAPYPNHIFLENMLNLSPVHSHNFEFLGGLSDVLRLQNEVKFFLEYYGMEEYVNEIKKRGRDPELNADWENFTAVGKSLDTNCTPIMLTDVSESMPRLAKKIFLNPLMKKRNEFMDKTCKVNLDLKFLMDNKHYEDLRQPFQLPEKVIQNNLTESWENGFEWNNKYYQPMSRKYKEFETELFLKGSKQVQSSMEKGMQQLKVTVEDYLRSRNPYTFDEFSIQVTNLKNQVINLKTDENLQKDGELNDVFNLFMENVCAFREFVFYHDNEE
ncbi:hypothetical protein ACFL1H_03180 [Nanoarchaeota archaeon]